MFNYRLHTAPTPVKVLVAGYLLALGLAYIYALGNIALVVGWTPRDIAVHYYGADKVVKGEQKAAEGEETFSLDEVDTKPKETVIGIRPSFKNLVQEGHFHLFGMTSFFFGLTLLGLFTGVKDSAKSLLVGVPYLAIIFDNLSFMATRFMGPHFAYLTAIAGGFMGICFTMLWLTVGYEIIRKA